MHQRIGIKLTIVVGLTAIIIIGFYAYLNIQSQSRSLLTEMERHAYQLSETVKKSMHHEMLNYHPDRIQETLLSISEDPCLYEIRILNKDGMIKYSTTKSGIGQTVEKYAESCNACHIQEKPLTRLPMQKRMRIFRSPDDSLRVMGIINPIDNEPSCWQSDCHSHSADKTILGVLEVTLCLKEVDDQISKSKVQAGIFAVIAIMAISVLIGIFVKKWVDTPVNSLLEATKQVAVGNLTYTIEKLSNDELGLLADSFNHMTKKMAEARQQLFQSDKMASLGRLAAGVAHEINNPLTGVLTYSSFLQKRMKNNPEILQDLNVIVRETLRSREIVKGLLDFARQSIPKKQKTDFNDIIIKAIKVIEGQLSLKHIKIITRLASDLPAVVADANQIQQVFINLLVNAGDAIGIEGGLITVTSSVLRLPLLGNYTIKSATCPKTHSLIDHDFKIDGLPSIKIKAISDGHEGVIHLDPIYGRNRHHFSLPYLKSEIRQLACPQCNISLLDGSKLCPRCHAAIYSLLIPSKGVLEGCSRYGCNWQRWEVIDALGAIEYIESTVADTGCGISETSMEKIFEPFYSTKGQSGTGLGLSVIWGILDNHGGSITVKSKVDQGTTFTLRVPVRQYV
jgi:two-component system NtrC family sensor kinase